MIHLIDPTVRIPSTTDVAPQQRELIQEVMREPRSLFRRLPVEINEMITNLVEGLMTRAEAEGYRNQLLKEREFFVDQNTSKYFGQVSSFYENREEVAYILDLLGIRYMVCGRFCCF